MKFINVDALRRPTIPMHVNILKEAIKAAKLCKVPILVQVSFSCFTICEYPWLLIKAAIDLSFGHVKNLTE